MIRRMYPDSRNNLFTAFDGFMDSFFTPFFRRANDTEASEAWAFSPAFESGWTDDHLNLRFVVPGVKEKDLKLTVQGNQLYVSGERRAPENFGKDGHVWSKVMYGKFERVLDLPNGLDLDKMQAYLHDGFLDIRIPLAGAMKPKEIQISTGKAPKQIAT